MVRWRVGEDRRAQERYNRMPPVCWIWRTRERRVSPPLWCLVGESGDKEGTPKDMRGGCGEGEDLQQSCLSLLPVRKLMDITEHAFRSRPGAWLVEISQ